MDSEEAKIEDPPTEAKPEENPAEVPPPEAKPEENPADLPPPEAKPEENPADLPPPEGNPSELLPKPEENPPDELSGSPDDPSPEKIPEAKDGENHSEANPVSIHITLQDLKDPSKKSVLNLDIADNLFYKDALEKSKFDAFKLKFKANEASEMQEVPSINKQTKNILQKKKISIEQKKKKQASVNYDNFDRQVLDRVHDHRRAELLRLQKVDHLNTNVMKNSMKAREDFEKAKEKADQKVNELITKCKIAEIQSSGKQTKAPDTKVSQETKKNSKSASVASLQSVMVPPDVLKSRVPPPNKSTHIKSAVNIPLDSVLISKNYSQLTPFSASFRYNSGYNQEDLLSKSRPMVDYKIPLSPTAN